MKKLTKLLVLSGLAISLLTGCTINGGKGGEGGGEEEVVKTLQSIEISAQPTKVSYLQDEAFDATGLEVKAVYNTGKEVLAATAYTLSGFDSSTAGPKTITVTYEGKTAQFDVNVIGKDGLSITAPSKLYYLVGEELDLTGLVVAQKYDGAEDKILSASEYTVTGFSSAEAGEVTLTITVGAQTGTVKLYVFERDWSALEKAYMSKYLLYPVPYYISMEFGFGDMWLEGESQIPMTEDDVDEYCALLEDIETTAGDPAWSLYSTKLTDDAGYLGFADDSYVAQYARWLYDEPGYVAFQIISVGLNDADHLFFATTYCAVAYAGFGSMVYEGGWNAAGVDSKTSEPYDMVEELGFEIIDMGSQLTFGPASLSKLPLADVVFPDYAENTILFIDNLAYSMPYIYGNAYSNYFDGTLVTLTFRKDTEEEGVDAYEEAALETIKAAYEAAGVEIKYPTPRDGSFYVELEQDGFVLSVNYSYDYMKHDIIVEFETLDYEVPFSGDFSISRIFDELDEEAMIFVVDENYEMVFVDDPEADFDIADYIIDYSAMVPGMYIMPFYGLYEDGLAAEYDLLHAAAEADFLYELEDENDEIYFLDAMGEEVEFDEEFGAYGLLKYGVDEAVEATDIDVSLASYEDGVLTAGFNVLVDDTDPNNPVYDVYALTYTDETGVLTLAKNGGEPEVFAARADAEDYTGLWTKGEGEDTITLALGEFHVVEAQASFFIEDELHNMSQAIGMISEQVMPTKDGSMIFYSLQLIVRDGMAEAFESWKEAVEELNGLFDQYSMDLLPEELVSGDEGQYNLAAGANNFVANHIYESAGIYSFDIYFETKDDAEESWIGGVLLFNGWHKGLNVNGTEVFYSPNGMYCVVISPAEGDKVNVTVCLLSDPTDDLVDAAIAPLAKAEYGWDLDAFMAADGDLGMTSLTVAGNVVTLGYEDADAALAAKAAVEAGLVGYVLDTDDESATKGKYVGAKNMVEVEIEEGVITITYLPLPAPEAPEA